MTKTKRQYGLWPSPVSPASVAGSLRLSDVQWDSDGSTLVWLEEESGHGTLVAYDGESAPRRLTDTLSVRARVGYGGGDFHVHDGSVYFVERESGRLHRLPVAGGLAEPITPPCGLAACPTPSPDGRWVAYVHTVENVDRLAVVDASGSSWPQILAQGSDFYMQPSWHPDGRHLAWVEWDHPSMPWIGCRLVLATLAVDSLLPRIVDRDVVAGGPDTSVFQPEFSRDGRSLRFITDEADFGVLNVVELDSRARRTFSVPGVDLTLPAWIQGMRTHGELPEGNRIFVTGTKDGFAVCLLVNTDTNEVVIANQFPEYTSVDQPTVNPVDGRVASLASSSRVNTRIVVGDSTRAKVVRRSSVENLGPGDFSNPEPRTWDTSENSKAHGLFYAPVSSRFESDGLPPLVVLVHGGPTSQHRAAFSGQVQFLTTRGYAVLAPNHRGSTGYGRAYMTTLERNWGVFDVEDSVSGAESLVRAGLVDAERMAIMGGSAGGFTVLQTMIEYPNVFAAGICLFGVSNQLTLAASTHKFELRYSDWLLGTLPEASRVYRERSPEYRADEIRRPLALFHGEDDVAVPRSQSDAIARALERSRTPHLYRVFPGEGHGWRRRETIEEYYASLESFLTAYLVYR
jgi:dipeptidyl aminopeptidase/acylaminoacyl peptidase